MIRMLGISGSLRHGSYNTALLRAAAELVPDGVTLEARTLHGIPLYDGDVEAEGVPDGVLLVTPEYNNGIPGVFKNAIDWASRPPADSARIFGCRPFAIIGASPGGFGTLLAQNHWLPVLRTLGANLWTEGRLMVSRAGSVFDGEGAIADPRVREQLQAFMAGFAAMVARMKG